MGWKFQARNLPMEFTAPDYPASSHSTASMALMFHARLLLCIQPALHHYAQVHGNAKHLLAFDDFAQFRTP